MRESFKSLLSLAMMAGVFGAVAIGSGCTEPDGSCTFNDDCEAGQVCNTATATCEAGGAECTTSADCGEGQFCIAGESSNTCGAAADCNDLVDDDKSVACGADEVCNADGCGAAADCSGEEDPAAFCASELGLGEGESASCVDGACVQDEVMSSYRYVLISDISTTGCEDTNADGEYDPGSDIMYVELRDANGQTLAWGSTEEYEKADDPNNDYTDSAIIDGMAPSLIADGSEDDGCPDAADRFNAMTVVSLGCGGSLLVGFDQPIYDDYVVNVGEYAPICNQNTGGSPTGTTDKYEVKLCPATEEGTAATIAGCLVDGTDIHPNTDGGIKQCTVTGAGAAE
jgi:hypothetical protein